MSAGVLWECVYGWRLLLLIYQLERHMLEPCRADVCICVYKPICAFSAFGLECIYACVLACVYSLYTHRQICPLSYKIPRCDVGHRNKCTNSKQTWRTDRLTLCERKEDRMWTLHNGTTIDLTTTLQCVCMWVRQQGKERQGRREGKKARQTVIFQLSLLYVFLHGRWVCVHAW